MGVIDNNCERLSFVNVLHASRDACNSCQPPHDSLDWNPLAVCCGDGGQAIADVKTAHQSRFDQAVAIRKYDAKTCARGVQLQLCCAYGGRRIYAIVENGNTTIGFEHFVADIIAIENSHAMTTDAFIALRVKHFEEARFRSSISINGFM